MIISKAIEILEYVFHDRAASSDSDTFDAIKLGNEALKRIQNCRQHPWSEIYAPLPGESMPERGIR